MEWVKQGLDKSRGTHNKQHAAALAAAVRHPTDQADHTGTTNDERGTECSSSVPGTIYYHHTIDATKNGRGG